mmetsp:Transcript_13293/g.11768  ORF Transcript_13293/g.11768 Transcript_13293/m.11768 type:complete len:226 (-) Transcript_13293:584-1261(-)
MEEYKHKMKSRITNDLPDEILGSSSSDTDEGITVKFLDQSQFETIDNKSMGKGLSVIIGDSEARDIRENEELTPLPVDDSPFRMTHISHLDEEMEDADKTVRKLIQNIEATRNKKDEKIYFDSVEKAKRPENGITFKINQENAKMNRVNTGQRMFRDSSRDLYDEEYNDIITESEVSTALETYLNSEFKEDKNSINTLFQTLKINENIPIIEDNSDNKAREIIQK